MAQVAVANSENYVRGAGEIHPLGEDEFERLIVEIAPVPGLED